EAVGRLCVHGASRDRTRRDRQSRGPRHERAAHSLSARHSAAHSRRALQPDDRPIPQVRAEPEREVPGVRHRHPGARRGGGRRPRPLFHGLRPSALTSEPARGDASAARRLRRGFPFLDWPRIPGDSLRRDLFAGLTVSLVAIPQSLAYAQLAGVPPLYGLYAAFIPSIVGVLFGSSPILVTGPVAMTSLLTAASVGALVPAGTEQFYAYVIMLALLSGLFQLAFGIARAGMLLSLVSHPVLIGFINAAALTIALSQLPALLGISLRQSQHLIVDSWNVVTRPDLVHSISLAFGVATIVLVVALRRFAPRLPGVLIAVVLSTWASYLLGFAERGGRVVGEIPAGLPALSVPEVEWSAVRALLPAAFIVAFISFMEAASSAKVIAIRMRIRWDENQELVGQGLAKIVAAFCQSMPVSGSFSRSALNLAAGAATGVSSLFAAAAVLVTLL